MTYYLFLGATSLVLLLALVAAWSRRTRWVRWLTIVIAIWVLPLSWLGLNDLLSRPKPVDKEWLYYNAKVAQVLGYYAEAGGGLWVMLKGKDWPEPREYFYPWNENTRKMIQELQEAWEKGNQRGVPTLMFNPFQPSWEKDNPIFRHPPPMPRQAPKFPPDAFTPKPREYSA